MRRGCKRLQNAGVKIVRLTSRFKSPYFPKLDSSFCQIGPDDWLQPRESGLVLKLLCLVNGWIRMGVGSVAEENRRLVKLLASVRRWVSFGNDRGRRRMREPRMVYMK